MRRHDEDDPDLPFLNPPPRTDETHRGTNPSRGRAPPDESACAMYAAPKSAGYAGSAAGSTTSTEFRPPNPSGTETGDAGSAMYSSESTMNL